jgi:hypothetical protein
MAIETIREHISGAKSFRDLPIATRRSLCSVSTFAWMLNHKPSFFKPYWHTKLLDTELEKVFSGEHPYLMINCPPRVGKTMSTMLYGATRYFAMHPDENVYIVTYNQPTANRFGAQCKEVFRHNAGDLFNLKLSKKRTANESWGIEGHEGSFNCIGWGGGITGQKCHLIILDDLIKDTEEALSEKVRDKIWAWIDMTLLQRVQDNDELKTKLVSVGTRWHSEDHLGRLLDQENEGGHIKWRKLILPALAEDDVYHNNELIMRKGESLCPGILPLEYLENRRDLLSRFAWNATYQQRPITQDGLLWEGSLFSESQWVDKWPSQIEWLVVAVDPATGRALRDGDYSAVVALGSDRTGQLYCEADLEKDGPFETVQRLARFCTKKLPRVPDVVGIESNAMQFLIGATADDVFHEQGINCQIMEVDNVLRDAPRSKEDRITEGLDAFIRNRDIKFVRSRGTGLTVRQLRAFPSRTAHDDGPDALEVATFLLSEIVY